MLSIPTNCSIEKVPVPEVFELIAGISFNPGTMVLSLEFPIRPDREADIGTIDFFFHSQLCQQ